MVVKGTLFGKLLGQQNAVTFGEWCVDRFFFLAEYFVSVSKAFRNSIHINMSFVLALPYLSTFWSTDSVAPGPRTQHSLTAGLNTAPNICVYFSV